ncbi:MAG: M1 family metallopeptidase [Ginsengibacter sp.]
MEIKRLRFIVFCLLFVSFTTTAQSNYWQQHVKYVIKVDMDTEKNLIHGKQTLEYTNNSPDDLKKVFFNLYWNAFQPGSQMDVRSRELGKSNIGGQPDWDRRVTDRISKLSPSEIGYNKVKSLKINGVEQPMNVVGTILEVTLLKPIKANSKVVFDMVFEAQVPVQIRRSGRDNEEGVRYSMSQWFPKIVAYDFEGWHPAQYVAREFYAPFGDFDVTINIDKNYKLGGTGVLMNASEIGWGYDKPGTPLKNISGAKRSWHFVGKNVHDFVWAADPEYEHITKKLNGVDLHVIYKKGTPAVRKSWEKVMDAAYTMLPYIEKRFGAYPYPQYSFIQGGDGGMEYAMATLLKGPGLGTVFHELMHNWYHMVLATNEISHPWMDEGFTSWSTSEVGAYYDNILKGADPKLQLRTSHDGAYRSYYALSKSGLAEPMTTFSDHYETNYAFSVNAYSKGAIYLEQLGYIVGDSLRDKILLEYFNRWKFKHPTPNDFKRVAEDVSGMQLSWYNQYWVNTTKTIDYKIDSLWEEGGNSKIRLRRIGDMPMPIDLKLTFKDSSSEMHYIPLDLMFGNKPAEGNNVRIVHKEWHWTNPTYTLEFKHRLGDLISVEIDPSKRMADVDQSNNTLKINW